MTIPLLKNLSPIEIYLWQKKATEHLKSNKCTRAILSAGNMHVKQWTADLKTFPNYTGQPIPGIIDLVDKKVTQEPLIIDLFTNRDRICPEGQARIKVDECKIEFNAKTTTHFEVELPKDFFLGHAQKIDKTADPAEAGK